MDGVDQSRQDAHRFGRLSMWIRKTTIKKSIEIPIAHRQIAEIMCGAKRQPFTHDLLSQDM